ncbi:CHAD domain-containing protein [Aeromicrobium sp.]|uniref:CHAD domain-containing protein n=1 Tax=Aeromicrobium sp. TaxID=1871063 RepID=UPI0019C0DC03|nr:CHAD domain-containing protein [Aeromicrobium sp.]MBC7632375.1 CHAD domain-containing protein [Aeromicrobium sp.]
MASSSHTFQAPAAPGLELATIVGALRFTFVVDVGTTRVVRRNRLDTFDRRLHAAGLALEHRATASGEQLVLSRLDGALIVAAPVTNMRWPSLVDALPAGSVRDVIAPIIDIRALTMIEGETRNVRVLSLRNSDRKIVARLDLDEPDERDTGPATARVTMHVLRGYDQQGGSAIGLLTKLGLVQIERPEPELRTARATVRTRRSTPARELLITTLRNHLATMSNNVPGVIDDIDTEFLHDLRVAVRRTRAVLTLGRPSLPAVMRDRWEPVFKELGDRTTPVRDLDVYELNLPMMGGWLVAAGPDDLEPLARHLRQHRTAERRGLVRYLKSATFQQLLSEWGEVLAQLADPRGDQEHLTAGNLADRSIRRAFRRVSRGGAAITEDSPAQDLHALRKDCKSLRYALEAFSPVLATSRRKRGVSDLKGLQDVLGRFQDCEVERRALHGFAEDMMAAGAPAGAILAMGELIGHLDGEQDVARREFDEVFTHFARPSNQRMMRRLGGLE